MGGLIQPISQELFDIATNNLTEPLAFATRIEELPYGIVFSVEFTTLYYNRAQIDTPPDIFDDLLDQTQTHPFVIMPDFFTTSGWFFASGGLLMGNEADNRVSKSFLELFLDELQDLAVASGVVFSTDQTAFVDGRASYLLASSADYPTLQGALADDLGIARLPRFPPKQWSTLVAMHVAMQNLNSTAEAVDASTTFAAFLIESDSQRLWFEQTGQAPANPFGLENDELRLAWSRTLEWGKPAPLPGAFDDVMYPALDQAVQMIVLSGQNPEPVAQATVDRLDSALEDSD
jgi:maltose-binding protein MalE